ncbi:MAG TPA: hypothetical protein V6C57_19310 [Coleofasciculaceae cyanobacterium]
MKIAKQNPAHLKLVYRPWIIWSLALFFWIADCYCIIFPPPSAGLVILFLMMFPLALVSLYPIVICDLLKDIDALIIKQYGFWGQRIAEYPLRSVAAIEVVEGKNSNGNRFYKIRLITKAKPLYLATAPIEDIDRAHFIAQSVSKFLEVPLNFVPVRSYSSAAYTTWD